MTAVSTVPAAKGRPGRGAAVPVRQRVSLVLLLAAIADSVYLTWAHFQPQALVCGLNGGCHTVQSSDYAMLGPVPVAVLGLVTYVGLMGLWLLRAIRPAHAAAVTVAMVGALTGAVAYFGYLTWVELTVLNAICQWCVLASLLTIGLLLTEGVGAWRTIAALDA